MASQDRRLDHPRGMAVPLARGQARASGTGRLQIRYQRYHPRVVVFHDTTPGLNGLVD